MYGASNIRSIIVQFNLKCSSLFKNFTMVNAEKLY
jgi:hypothetical protein